MKNIIHILKETSKCFEVSARTGQNIGFCDQLKSFYLCDLMWRELTPFIKAGIPSIIQKIERRGGGEYAKFSEAWKNTFDGLSYFVQVYGITATEAFKLRNIGEMGKMVCGKFYGIRYPKASSILEELGKPPVPYQFFVKVDEIPYTEVTYPPQSHYKVFYYLYAGTDQDIWYSVYLKNPPSYTGINVPSIYAIKTGFLPRGQSVAESPDFIAVAGYKEVCININGKEECGFEVVSSSYVVNWLQDKYVENQLKQNIKSREECISGKPSLIPTASLLNLQAGIEKAISPAIYREGIVRVCSSFNPGKGVEEENWKAVGECDAETKCWIYLPSIKQALKDLGIEKQTIEWAKEKHKEIFGILEDGVEGKELEGLKNEIIEAVKEIGREVKEIKEKRGRGEEIDIKEIIKKVEEKIKNFEEKRVKVLHPDYLKTYDYNLAKLYKYKTLLLFYKYEKKEEKKGEEIVEKKKEKEVKEEIVEKEEILPYGLLYDNFYYFFVIGKGNSYEIVKSGGETIEYDDEREVCVILIEKKENEYIFYNNYLKDAKVKVKGSEHKIQKINKKISITWEVILPFFKHTKERNGCNTTYKSEVEKNGEYNCSKEKYWIQLDSEDYEVVEYNKIDYEECVENSDCWCIKPKKEIGTYWYRAIIEIDEEKGKKFYVAGPLFMDEIKEDSSDHNIKKLREAYKKKGYNLSRVLANPIIIPQPQEGEGRHPEKEKEQQGWYKAGLLAINPSNALRISRKSNFGIEDEHEKWCNENEENKKRCDFIRLLESYYNVPYVEWTNISAPSEYLAMDCSTVVNATLKKITGQEDPDLEIKEECKNKNITTEIINKKECKISTGDLIEVPIPFYLVIVDENNNSTLDYEDSLIYANFKEGKLVRKKLKNMKNYLQNLKYKVNISSPVLPNK